MNMLMYFYIEMYVCVEIRHHIVMYTDEFTKAD